MAGAAAVAAAVASFLEAVLTEIYLCGVCSCREILRRNGRGQAARKRAAEDVMQKVKAQAASKAAETIQQSMAEEAQAKQAELDAMVRAMGISAPPRPLRPRSASSA
jgi:hypothetical protein